MRQLTLFFYFLFSTTGLLAVGIQDLTITTVDYQSAAFYYSPEFYYYHRYPLGISNSGVIVGDFSYFDRYTYFAGGFTYSGGVLTALNYPFIGFDYTGGVLTTFAYPSYNLRPSGINNEGTIILTGQYGVGFIGKPGAFTQLAFPGATSTYPNAINDAGVVVGSYIDANGQQHGFIYRPDGTYASFDAPFTGFGGTELTGINNLGDIVGFLKGQSFIIVNGSIDTLIGYHPTSINDNEQILFPEAYLADDILDYRTNTLELINIPGHGGVHLFQNSAGLNNSGVITGGNALDVLVPIPEPGTFLLALPAFVVLAIVAKRRRTLKGSRAVL